MKLSFCLLHSVNEYSLIYYTLFSFLFWLKSKFSMTVHVVIHPFSVVFSPILHLDDSLDLLIVMPNTFKHLSFNLAIGTSFDVAPNNFTVAITFVSSEMSSIDSLGPVKPFFISKDTLATHHSIPELANILVLVGELSFPEACEFAMQEVASLVSIIFE